MPITQIPFQDPVAPPEKPQPEQLALYDSVEWETAYQDFDARVPHLLIQLQDDLERSRRREAAWISIIVHLLIFVALWNSKLIEKYIPSPRAAVVAVDATKDKNLTMLALPPDAEKVTRKPKTNILSDKDRIAMSRRPQLDPNELRKILHTPPPGMPGPSGLPAAQPSPSQQATAQNQAPQQGQQSASRPQFETNQTAQLQMPPQRQNNSFSKYASPMSAGSAIQQATAAAAARRGTGGQEGYFGVNSSARGSEAGSLEILSDTMGVDFAPYLERIRLEILRHWYEVLPESVYPPILKKGKLAIEFAILQDGSVAGMRLAATSDDPALDRAAWGGIQGSNPFPPLPDEFTRQGGKYLQLRCIFFYNLSEKDLQ